MPQSKNRPSDDVEVVRLELPLDRETVSWLARLSRGCDDEAAKMIASMLKDIRQDDEACHATLH